MNVSKIKTKFSHLITFVWICSAPYLFYVKFEPKHELTSNANSAWYTCSQFFFIIFLKLSKEHQHTWGWRMNRHLFIFCTHFPYKRYKPQMIFYALTLFSLFKIYYYLRLIIVESIFFVKIHFKLERNQKDFVFYNKCLFYYQTPVNLN